MITMRTDLPEDVLGADASGTVTGQDYETVLVPAIEAFINKLVDQERVEGFQAFQAKAREHKPLAPSNAWAKRYSRRL